MTPPSGWDFAVSDAKRALTQGIPLHYYQEAILSLHARMVELEADLLKQRELMWKMNDAHADDVWKIADLERENARLKDE